MNTSDWIGIGVIALVIIGALFGLSQITKPYGVKNEEEFQKRRQEGTGLLNAAMLGLQQTLDPAAKKAVEVQQDLRRGIYDDKEEADDPPEAGGTHASSVPKED
ncbi:MAG TPA: hypothetical protein VLN44_12675 [Pyrinomonadaceae bacterium]|nr:hypothetical protein [Pyrinomonadaceae bacterium]